MGVFSKILGAIGFEDGEEVVKEQKIKKQNTKANFKFNGKGKQKRVEDIDGIIVFYVENLDETNEFVEYIKNKEPVIINIEFLKDAEKKQILSFVDGAIAIACGKKVEIEKGRFVILLPEGVEIEE